MFIIIIFFGYLGVFITFCPHNGVTNHQSELKPYFLEVEPTTVEMNGFIQTAHAKFTPLLPTM